MRAYGSTAEQASGQPFVNGEAGSDPCLQHVAIGDVVAGIFTAAAVPTTLAGRRRLGGSDIELARVQCLFQLGADARVQLVTDDASAPVDSVASVAVGEDVDEAYARRDGAGTRSCTRRPRSRGACGRFFVRAPDGTVLNVVGHRDE